MKQITATLRQSVKKCRKLMFKEEEFESQWRQSLEKYGKDPVKCFASISLGCKLISDLRTKVNFHFWADTKTSFKKTSK